MIIKKYAAATENEAVLKAKEELGKDAVIMNIKTIRPRGIYKLFKKGSVEITAAVDENEEKGEKDPFAQIQKVIETLSDKPAKDSKASIREENLKKNKDIIIEDEEEEKQEPENVPNAIEQKLDSLQDFLEKQIHQKEAEEEETEEEEDKNASCIKLIKDKLIENEVDEVYAEKLTSEIAKSLSRESTIDNILAKVYQKIVLKLGQPSQIEKEEGKAKYIFFLGPTGVGKTTTIAKIASSLKLSGKGKIALVTSDTYRIAAVEQLKTYANILGIPLKVVYSAKEMETVPEEYKRFDLVLVDTAGRSHNNKEQTEDIRKLIEAVPEKDREVYLVLSATTKYKDLKKIVEVYSDITKYSLIFTKLDETDCIGNIYNIRMLTGAPLSYTTWGQNVPDDMGTIDAQKIAKQLLGGNH